MIRKDIQFYPKEFSECSLFISAVCASFSTGVFVQSDLFIQSLLELILNEIKSSNKNIARNAYKSVQSLFVSCYKSNKKKGITDCVGKFMVTISKYEELSSIIDISFQQLLFMKNSVLFFEITNALLPLFLLFPMKFESSKNNILSMFHGKRKKSLENAFASIDISTVINLSNNSTYLLV